MEDNLNTTIDPEIEQLHCDLQKMFDDAEESFQTNDALAERDRDYVDGKQWTDDEKAKIVARGQAPIVVNRIKPKIDFLKGSERERRTDVKAFPRKLSVEADANAATEALRYVADNNDWDVKRSCVFDNALVEGYGAVQVRVKKKEIKIDYIPWDRFFYDPYAREVGLTDRMYSGIAIWMDLDDAKKKYKDMADHLEASIAEANTHMDEKYGDKPISRWVDPTRRRVRIIEIYYWKDEQFNRCVFSKAGILENPKKSAYEDDEGNSIDPFEVCLCYLDRDGNPYGVVRNWIDIQDEINKRRSKALYLLSVRQVKIVKGAVDDVNKARTELARPDGVLEVNEADGIDILNTSDMAQGQFSLLQEAKGEIDGMGANAALTGKDPRNLSGRAILTKAQSGNTEVNVLFDNLRGFQQRVFRKVWWNIRKYWKEEKWIRVTDDEQNVRFVGVNATVPDQYGNPVKVNDLGQLDVDIVVADAPDTITIQQEQFQELAEMARSGLQIPPDAIIEASSIRGKEKILKRMRGEFDDPNSPEAQMAMQQQQLKMAQVEADLEEKRAKALDLQAKAQERMANIRIKMAALEQKGVLGMAEIERDLELAGMDREIDLFKTGLEHGRRKEKG